MANILAVDPSSSVSGVALIVDDKLKHVDHFVSNKKQDLGARLHAFGLFLTHFRAKVNLDLVAVERMAVRRNLKTVRMVSYFEAAALIHAGQWKTPTLLLEVTKARNIALGKGQLSKDEVYEMLKLRYNLAEYENGGSDEADAIVVGLAAIKELKNG